MIFHQPHRSVPYSVIIREASSCSRRKRCKDSQPDIIGRVSLKHKTLNRMTSSNSSLQNSTNSEVKMYKSQRGNIEYQDIKTC